MKKLILILLIFCFPLLMCAYDTKIYKVAIVKDWKPYYFINDSGKADGYAVELFEHISQEINIKFEYVIVDNFQEIIQLLNENKVDIIPNIGITSDRESLLLFTQPTDNFMLNVYKRKGSQVINTITDVKNKKIGLVINNICTKIVDKKLIHVEKVFYADYRELIQALNDKKIDVFCYPKPLIEFESVEYRNNIVALDKSLIEIKRGVGISKSNFDVLPHLNEAISHLRLTGELDKLQAKWFKKKKYIELTRSETIFLAVSFSGIMFTLFIIVVYFIHKKKWLLTNKMLEAEVEKQTQQYIKQNEKLEQLQEKLQMQLNIDALTNIYNRKFYNQKIKEMLSLYQRYNTMFSFLILDIDDFKQINDNYGHAHGDKVLIELCVLIQKYIRENDYLFRIGGEEFIILFTNTTQEEAVYAAQNLCAIIAKELKVLQDKRQITVSMGLTQVQSQDTQESIFKRADALLYKAKTSGKNKVLFS
ncbi:MAG: GGDEF domain-containing protein [Arcobacteraceae bacterium]